MINSHIRSKKLANGSAKVGRLSEHAASSALTYFNPTQEAASRPIHWGLVATETREAADTIEVGLELPGLDRSAINVRVVDQCLLITGEKKTDRTERRGSIVVTERAYGQLQRSIPLGCPVNVGKTRARYKNGCSR